MPFFTVRRTVWTRTDWIWCGVFVVLALFWLLPRLGQRSLWQDEAQTALLAKTILSHGVPLGFDGPNSLSQELGAEFGPNLWWRWHTWGSFYLVAASLELLGFSTLAARLPFALLGAATVGLSYGCGRRWWDSRRAGIVTATLLLGCVPFALLARQSRYYAPAMFFALLALYAAWFLLPSREGNAGDGENGAPEIAPRWAQWAFGGAALALFHSHHIFGVTLLGATALTALLWRHKLRPGAARCVLRIYALVFVLCLPWALWLVTGSYSASVGNTGNLATAAQLLPRFVALLGRHGLTWAAIFVVVLSMASRFRSRRAGGEVKLETTSRPFWTLLWLFAGLTLTALSLFSPAAFFRYLAPLLPLCCLAIAGVNETAAKRFSSSLAWGVTGITLGIYALCQPIPAYFGELTHDFRGPVDGLVSYLHGAARPGDIVAITYEDLPLKFYTPLRVVGGLTGEKLDLAREARFIVVRRNSVSDKDAAVANWLIKNVDWKRYRAVVLPYPETLWQNREDPENHLYRTPATQTPLVIFERKD